MGLFDIQRGAGMVGGIQRPPPVPFWLVEKAVCRVRVFSPESGFARNIGLVENSHLIPVCFVVSPGALRTSSGNTLTWKTEES